METQAKVVKDSPQSCVSVSAKQLLAMTKKKIDLAKSRASAVSWESKEVLFYQNFILVNWNINLVFADV